MVGTPRPPAAVGFAVCFVGLLWAERDPERTRPPPLTRDPESRARHFPKSTATDRTFRTEHAPDQRDPIFRSGAVPWAKGLGGCSPHQLAESWPEPFSTPSPIDPDDLTLDMNGRWGPAAFSSEPFHWFPNFRSLGSGLSQNQSLLNPEGEGLQDSLQDSFQPLWHPWPSRSPRVCLKYKKLDGLPQLIPRQRCSF